MTTGFQLDEGVGNFETADTTISSQYLRVKISGAGTVGIATVTVAGVSAEDDIGVARERNIVAGNQIGVLLMGKQGTIPMVAAGAITARALVYPAASGKISATAAGAPLGVALEAASGDGSVISVLVFPKARGPRKITDPGNAGAIPVTHSGVCSLTSAGAETRTLAAPTFDGQIITLACDVDGGDNVVTAAAAFNQAGNNTITFNDAGDCVTLIARRQAGALKWSLLVNDGASLSTV
ncbi:MAG TPA: hypothetical protein VEA38_12135 [Terriglobales bacterium]|nr:hypothetical protein [Terriglobales bacterium]